MFDSILPISYYKEISVLDSKHGIHVVQHIETNKICIKKQLSVFDLDVYKKLFLNPQKGIPRIYAIYHDSKNNTLTVIEEYISGETFQEVLDIVGSLSPSDVINYTIQLCDVINSLHAFDPPIVHRDIKPSNIMLTEDERVVLIDLNAAHLNNPKKSKDTRLLGTEGFAAPEQFGFANSSPQTDIFSIGMLMNTLLTNSSSKRYSEKNKLAGIISKCLEMDPKRRYASAIQLKKSLLKISNIK